MKLVGKIFGALIFVVLVGIISLGLLLIYRPEAILQEDVVSFVLNKVLPEDTQISWEEYSFNAEIKNEGKKIYKWQLEDFCIEKKENIATCVDQAKLEVAFRLVPFGIEDLKVSKLTLSGLKGSLKTDQTDQENEQSSVDTIASVKETILDYLESAKALKLEDFKVTIDDFSVDDELRISGIVKGMATGANIALQTDIQLANNAGTFKTNVQLDTTLDEDKNELDVKLNSSLDLGDGGRIDVKLDDTLLFTPDGIGDTRVSYTGEVSGLKFKGEAEVSLKDDNVLLRLFRNKFYVSNGVRFEVTTDSCQLDVKTKRTIYSIDINCPISFRSKNVAIGTVRLEYLPRTFKGDVVGNIRDFKIGEEIISGKADLEVKLQGKEYADITLKAKDEFAYALATKKIELPYFSSNIKLANLQKLMPFLAQFSLIPPAPFTLLSGPIEFNAKLTKGGNSKIQFDLQTNLTSQNQVLKSFSTGSYGVRGKLLSAKVKLEEVELVAPNINVVKDFDVLPDKRIKVVFEDSIAKDLEGAKQENRGREKDDFKYQIKLITDEPIQLASDLSKQNIPVDLNLEIDWNKPVSGKVRVGQFKAELFRRKGEVQYLVFVLPEDRRPVPINGHITVNYTDYKVFIELVGTLEKPDVVLRSEPPLARQDIISTLLFGHPMDEGSSVDATSVASADSALAGRAVGLVSLYLFAATPIESVSYDPQTENFQLKVRVAKGTSFSIVEHGETDRRSYGLRKKIGDRLYINTELIKDLQQGGESFMTSLLEWFYRY